MGFLLALALSFLPGVLYAGIVYWLDRYEKEPKLLVGGVFLWGAFVATAGAIVSQLLLEGALHLATGSRSATAVAGATIFAPLTEEALKALAVLVVFLAFRREFDSVLDGIVYGATVALGFAATENVLYLYGAYGREGVPGLLSLFVLRVILGAWDHPFYTAFAGIGLAVSRLSPHVAVRWLAPPAGWGVGVVFHSLHNGLASLASVSGLYGLAMFLVDWTGWIFMGGVVLWALHSEGRLVVAQLAEEVEGGHLTEAHRRTAASIPGRMAVLLRAVGSGRFGATRRFYHACAELAHKKHQLERRGEEGTTVATIEALRGQISSLSPAALA